MTLPNPLSPAGISSGNGQIAAKQMHVRVLQTCVHSIAFWHPRNKCWTKITYLCCWSDVSFVQPDEWRRQAAVVRVSIILNQWRSLSNEVAGRDAAAFINHQPAWRANLPQHTNLVTPTQDTCAFRQTRTTFGDLSQDCLTNPQTQPVWSGSPFSFIWMVESVWIWRGRLDSPSVNLMARHWTNSSLLLTGNRYPLSLVTTTGWPPLRNFKVKNNPWTELSQLLHRLALQEAPVNDASTWALLATPDTQKIWFQVL